MQRKRITARGRQANIRSVYLDLRNKADTSVADESLNTISALQGSGLKKEGWLTKLSNSHGITGSGLQRWKRKWFVVENGRLGYRRDANSTTMTDTKGNLDLMLTTVKLQSKGRAAERAFTFEVREWDWGGGGAWCPFFISFLVDISYLFETMRYYSAHNFIIPSRRPLFVCLCHAHANAPFFFRR